MRAATGGTDRGGTVPAGATTSKYSDPVASGVDDGKPPLDLTVEVEDAAGRVARVPLSDYGPLRRPLEIHISRRPDLEEERFAELQELVLQSYTIPLSDLTSGPGGVDPARLVAVRLVFDRVHAGEVVVDDIGFARLRPAFWEARVGR